MKLWRMKLFKQYPIKSKTRKKELTIKLSHTPFRLSRLLQEQAKVRATLRQLSSTVN
jgi:hypothetical protein